MTRNHVLVILLQPNKKIFFSYRGCYRYPAVKKRDEVDNTGINLILDFFDFFFQLAWKSGSIHYLRGYSLLCQRQM